MKNYLQKKFGKENGSVTPYFIGWILGVPGSVLLIIFVLRGCR